MWFKNIRAYRLTQSLTLAEEILERALLEQHFRPCGKQDISSTGFESPFAAVQRKDGPMFHKVADRYWFCLRKQERILPPAVINSELAKRVADIEAQTGTPVGKKAQQELKQQLITTLLPQAFTKDTYTQGFIAVDSGMVVVDAAADNRAEAFLAMLRKVLGSLPVVPLFQQDLSPILTQWLQTTPPAPVDVLQEAEFIANDDSGAVVKCKNQPLDSEEIQALLAADKRVKQLAIGFDERISLNIADNGACKRIRFNDVLQDSLNDVPKEDKSARLDAEFALLSGELVQFLTAIAPLLGEDLSGGGTHR